MQPKTRFNVDTLVDSSVLSFAQCILELVRNSLSAHAAAIAIRIHAEKREIHVIDNGIGIPRDKLERIAELTTEATRESNTSNNNTLTNIRQLSDALAIASRYQDATETFVKVFETDHASELAQMEQRPSRGTTVSVYGFRETHSNRNSSDMFAICFLIATIAVAKLKVSFSIRDEKRRKVVLRIARPHSPVQVLRTLFGKSLPSNHVWLINCNAAERDVSCYGYIGFSEEDTVQWTFLNDKPIVDCQRILTLIKAAFKGQLIVNRQELLRNRNMFILIFLRLSPRAFTFAGRDENRYVIFHDTRKILNLLKNCAFKQLCLTETIADCPAVPFFDKRHGKNNDCKAIDRHAEGRKTASSNNTQYRTISTELPYCENKVANDLARNNLDKTHNTLADLATNQVSPERDEEDRISSHSDFVKTSPLSVWSDWAYRTDEKERDTSPPRDVNAFSRNIQKLPDYGERFDFLPRKLCNLVRPRAKLTNVQRLSSPNNTILLKDNWRCKQISVYPCNSKEKLCEFRLSHASLKYFKVINQVNKEFIVARIIHEKMNILLMMDQHAVHERIRYEKLLLRYKTQNESELLSISLRNPLAVKLRTEACNLLLRNKALLKRYGVHLGSVKENTLLIRTVPQCLITSNDHGNTGKLLLKIHNLFNDILRRHNTTNQATALPLTIHNAIASEACHGAIKFGDKLTLQQCFRLVKLLKRTKFPNRCAHGRPTVVPVMELSELERRDIKRYEKKLNFAILRNRHWNTT